jgi:hypothetical protein
MNTQFLLPRKFRTIGWLIFLPACIAGILMMSGLTFFINENTLTLEVFALFNQDFLSHGQSLVVIQNSLSDEILLTMIVVGGMMTVFSKANQEDEMISKIRYESLVWATYLHFAILLLATFFIYGTYYMQVLIANLFTLLFFFIIRFHVMI